MLGKLIKYEFKATNKFMFLMYGLFLAMSGMISVGLLFNLDEIMKSIAVRFDIGGWILAVFIFIFATLFVALNIIVVGGMFFYAIGRFKNNLLGNEGYLMHTLPVKTRDNILAKVIVSVIWTIAGFVVSLVSYLIIFIGITDTQLFKSIHDIVVMIDWDNEQIALLIPFALMLCLMVLAEIVNIYLSVYASMSVGFSSNTHKMAKSIGFFVLLKIVEKVFETLMVNAFGILKIENSVYGVIWFAIIISAIESTVYYFITHYFLGEKLNL